ncbi:hypothetical protein J4437_01675 [Candidatus Woesearchaeota archaeon]|nr:hypothetical protein [Candidatus Woesearchaeota archaeon]
MSSYATLVYGHKFNLDELTRLWDGEKLTYHLLYTKLLDETSRLSVERIRMNIANDDGLLRPPYRNDDLKKQEKQDYRAYTIDFKDKNTWNQYPGKDILSRANFLIGTCLAQTGGMYSLEEVLLPSTVPEKISTTVLNEFQKIFPRKEWTPNDFNIALLFYGEISPIPRPIHHDLRTDYQIPGYDVNYPKNRAKF